MSDIQKDSSENSNTSLLSPAEERFWELLLEAVATHTFAASRKQEDPYDNYLLQLQSKVFVNKEELCRRGLKGFNTLLSEIKKNDEDSEPH